MRIKKLVEKMPNVVSLVTSPKFAAALGVGVALFQLAGAVEQLFNMPSKRQKIGFDDDRGDEDNSGAAAKLAALFGKKSK